LPLQSVTTGWRASGESIALFVEAPKDAGVDRVLTQERRRYGGASFP